MSETNNMINDRDTSVTEYTPEERKRRDKKKKRYRRKRIFRGIKTFLLMLILAAYAAVGVFGLKLTMKMTRNMPELNVTDLLSEESSMIYDTNGNLVTEIGTYYRENITYDQCPESLVDAFLSIEDSRFFEHNGFDVPRFSKAVIETLVRGDQQGGSTFTMQLVKNSYFSIDAGDESVERSATIEYKVQQILLSMQLETQLSKKEVFELYMNKLNFGDRIRGVQKAAEYYYGKDVQELSLTESAMLAGIINLPNGYNPYHYLDYATTRRNEVLNLMYAHGYITKDELSLAKSIKVEDLLVGVDNLNVESAQYSQYVDVVIDEAQRLTGRDPVLYGMKIYTALNPTIQNTIEAIENGTGGVRFADDLMQTAIVTLDNTNGEIVGIGGGRNYTGGARLLNRATDQYKQPGSSVKPILEYALSFEHLGYSLDETLLDSPHTYPGESMLLSNASATTYAGDINIKDAVSRSLNIPAIKTLEKVTAKIGGEAVVDYMHSLGFSRASNENYHMSYGIGGNAFETTVAELAGAHAALINHGIYNKPHTIRMIEMTDGTLYYPEDQNIRVISSGSAYLTSQLMAYNVQTGYTYFNYMGVLQRSYPVYAKTGTTDWGTSGLQYGIPRGAMKDKWMVASTSNYTNCVWVGYDKAIANAGTYFSTAKAYMNIPGYINSALITAEETIPNVNLAGVTRPDDVIDITYAQGTYPHNTSGVGAQITSQVSKTGLTKVPSVTTTGTMTAFAASYTNYILYIDWGAHKGCYAGIQDVSLSNYWNDEHATGACMANTVWAYGSNPTFMAAIYQDDQLITTVTSKDGTYGGYPGISQEGVITVCGWYSNGSTVSNQQCTVAYDFNLKDKDSK